MSLYTDIRDAVFVWTGRPDLTAETDAAITQALRAAHKSGTYFRDLETLPLTNVSTDQIQAVDLTSVAPMFDQLALVKPTGLDAEYTPVDIRGLLDQDGYAKLDVCWIVGTTLNIRASSPSSDITLIYYKRPLLTPLTSLNSWIADLYPEVVILGAAATVLNLVGEQEIKARAEKLLSSSLRDLTKSSTESVRR